MKVFGVAALFLLLTGPAYAQMPNVNLFADQPSKTPEQIEQEKARDKAYKDTLKSIPDAKTSNDPWGGVRSDAPRTPPAKSSAGTKAKSKAVAKTGGNNSN